MNGHFNTRLNETDRLEQVEGDCGNGCHVPLHLSASKALKSQRRVKASAVERITQSTYDYALAFAEND
jgi:hypothetical protein